MTSYKHAKLQALTEEENKIKERKRILTEEIELEIEKNRILELESTIIKLRTQVDQLSKNIEGEIMPNNIQINPTATREERNENNYHTTLSKFIKNISHLSEQELRQYSNSGSNKRLVIVPNEIKIYHDMTPILTTIIGILYKQQQEINELKQ
tara:strand:+ start:514 stop:972 length:459 start_codon:yes stop_codon:yes gene_type:complete